MRSTKGRGTAKGASATMNARSQSYRRRIRIAESYIRHMGLPEKVLRRKIPLPTGRRCLQSMMDMGMVEKWYHSMYRMKLFDGWSYINVSILISQLLSKTPSLRSIVIWKRTKKYSRSSVERPLAYSSSATILSSPPTWETVVLSWPEYALATWEKQIMVHIATIPTLQYPLHSSQLTRTRTALVKKNAYWSRVVTCHPPQSLACPLGFGSTPIVPLLGWPCPGPWGIILLGPSEL
mmetsp:Transcript_4309/g.8985  ORF Transcript_4309/g.8985 Transcript_4309/m.8985 type:complete len:236 (+) Transcript_4309:828-1535(+)